MTDGIHHICAKQSVDIGFIKHILAMAEIAIDLNAALFRHHAADFFHPNSAAYATWAQLFADEWAASRRQAAPVVADAPQWGMLSARVAQSEYEHD